MRGGGRRGRHERASGRLVHGSHASFPPQGQLVAQQAGGGGAAAPGAPASAQQEAAARRAAEDARSIVVHGLPPAINEQLLSAHFG